MMLEKANMSKMLLKEDYRIDVEPLKEKLSNLQHEVKSQNLPVIVIFEGWGTAGKGSILSDVILTLDPRNFKTKSTLAPTVEELREPFLWRHWRSIPAAGLFQIYDRSWYPEASSMRITQNLSKKVAYSRMDSINIFERQLAQDGTLIIKFFLHITQKEQKARLKKLASKKATAWRVEQEDYKLNRQYNEFYAAYDEMLEYTNSEAAPWHVVASKNRYAALSDVYHTLVTAIEDALQKKKAAGAQTKKTKAPLSAGEFTLMKMPELHEVHLGKTLEQDEYKEKLKKLQKRLKTLHNILYLRKIPLIMAYEGWDAAGKGGNIKRVTAALDPRGYEVIPIASPTPPEKARQYLWRFWEHLPKDGHIAIFDRTWYGRVMVERVEGFAKEEEWQRAYREINEFEHELTNWGAIVLKFWLHISKEEQLRRFEARQNTPEKLWKITDEDWRNREKWDAYELAINDMLRLTSTDFAPWTIIESENKQFGRIKTLEAVIDAIEAKL